MAYQVLVVDDSVFMRKIISDMVGEDSRFHVAGTAKNGREALEKVKELNPDVITMDVEMPVMDGLEALALIMKEKPTPVIMLSSLTQEGAMETVKALERGAVDFLQKPSGSVSFDLHKVRELLHEKLLAAVHSKVLPAWVQDAAPEPVLPRVRQIKETSPEGSFEHLVAMGTSTGGPRALHAVISGLPADFPAPVLVVQHMPPKFTKSLADRLNAVSPLLVKEAEDGEGVERGKVLLAPGGYHMAMVQENGGHFRIKLTEEEPRMGHRPSVDYLFESLLPFRRLKRHIVLMTGMGSDGAKGMLALRQAGAFSTTAESEESCVVYGMPRAAVHLNGAMHVQPLPRIASHLVRLTEDGIDRR
ncbi:chemotaxis response regulator protein-glutamate methylesterase [Paenibacillus aurantius]|uniref:Protein-glutamate methylesterase/protein-glutamine glutaminase n=1 Tax=Paenibacillus aurantius TaxID=2918900 RepID=A0AA96RH81_9BACL|nr:chemotaxis response regulator protein-glutamate methylesterase [Paenibacillus aurantius]WNQ13752.1 chemotaxis response regulator protein-glutamate methylesterase [Paenibacillus aurantius]